MVPQAVQLVVMVLQLALPVATVLRVVKLLADSAPQVAILVPQVMTFEEVVKAAIRLADQLVHTMTFEVVPQVATAHKVEQLASMVMRLTVETQPCLLLAGTYLVHSLRRSTKP